MGGPERALTAQIEATSPRRTTVLYARVDGRERPRGPALRRRVRCVAALSQAAELSGGLLAEVRDYERAELLQGTSAGDSYEPTQEAQVPSWLS